VPFTTNFQGSGFGRKEREAVIQALTLLFAGKPGRWHVQFIHDGDLIEMRVSGPGVETSDYVGAPLDPEAIAGLVTTILTD
jgi:hypothetical protein